MQKKEFIALSVGAAALIGVITAGIIRKNQKKQK